METKQYGNNHVDIELNHDHNKSMSVFYNEKEDTVTIIFYGDGQRYVQSIQNRSDGHNSIEFTTHK